MKEKTPKSRTRMWVSGDSEYNQQFIKWAKSQGMIAEDLLRMIVDNAMQHGTVSFVVDGGYEISRAETETH